MERKVYIETLAWNLSVSETYGNRFQIGDKLAFRLQEGIKAWTKALKGRDKDEDMDSTEHETAHKLGGEPKIQVI